MRITQMMKPFAALLLSGVLAVTSLTATSAAADSTSDDLAKLLLGALVLYGIKEAVDDRRKVTVTPSPAPQPVISSKKRLPRHCIRTHSGFRGETRTVFGNRCLRNNYRHYASLPERCFRRFETVRGVRAGWGPKCLNRTGFIW
ncbi:MAG: hypothetical protein AAF714_05385 [Pseudomonadota bacterium]